MAATLLGFAMLAGMLGGVVGLLALAEAVREAQARVVRRQIMLTDAIHEELGALVAPVVEKRPFGPWSVTLPAAESGAIDRLVAITSRVLRPDLRGPDDLRIVVTRGAVPSP